MRWVNGFFSFLSNLLYMKLLRVEKSTNPNKKMQAVFKLDNGHERIVRFGAPGYSDYLHHQDNQRKLNYISRHQSTEKWDDPLTPGACARWILWNKKTLEASIKDFKRRFNI